MTNTNFLSLKMQVASQNTGNYFSTGGAFININQNKLNIPENTAAKLEALQAARAVLCLILCSGRLVLSMDLS